MGKYLNSNLSIEERVEDLLSKMTLGEKLTQMLYNSAAIERLGVPEYNWWNEALHGVARAGVATVFPQAIGLAAMFDENFMETVAEAISDEGRAKYKEYTSINNRGIYKGLTYWSPNINIFRDPRWGRGHETYGEDPYLTSRMGIGFIKDVLLGNYNGTPSRYATVLQDIRNRVSQNTKVIYAEGCDLTKKEVHKWEGDLITEAVLAAQKSQVVIMCRGLSPRIEGEEGAAFNADASGDRIDIGLPGRLPITFVKTVEDLPHFEDYSMKNRTYRFIEKEPLYPFGFGLSYTKFQYSNLKLKSNTIVVKEDMDVSFEVENVGALEGEEVAQVYLKDCEASTIVPKHQLVGFTRFSLKPGEKKNVKFTIKARTMAVIKEDGSCVIEPGKFIIYAGGSQPAGMIRKLMEGSILEDTFVVEGKETIIEY